MLLLVLQGVLWGQVSAPNLRCLRVINANGDLEITWLAPSDPQNQFYGYEIFVGNAKAGPYTSVTATAGAISATQFVHTGTVTNVQSLYVYMRSLFGAGGANKSANSDTLQSIFLNINVSIADAYKLTYNAPHTPLLPGYSPSLSIARNYENTYTPLYYGTNYTFFDTLSYCNKQQSIIHYTVGMADASGCINGSNWQGGVYFDRHNPYVIYIDSISVLANGNTCIGWKPAVDKDVVKYVIQKQNQAGLNPTIAVVPGYTAGVYVLNDNSATSSTVGLYVQPIDSCGNGGVVDYVPTTMFLKTKYDFCAFKTELSWNAYKWASKNNSAIDSVLEYRIYCSEDSGQTYKRIGTTTATNFTHLNVSTNKSMLYFVRVINQRKSMTASSNRTGFFSGEIAAPEYLYIKSCSVIKKNTINLSITTDETKPFRRILIFRSSDGVTFDTIGSIKYAKQRNYDFSDEKVYTDARPYYYYAWMIDSCENVRVKSNYCKSILLKVSEDESEVFQRNLSWNAYQGYDAGVREYEIWRSVYDAGISEVIAKTDSLTLHYTDNLEGIAGIGARIEYVVKAVENFGNRYAIQERSNSNFALPYMEPRVFVPNAFAPGGHNSTWKPVTQYIENREYNVSVFNAWGQTVFSSNDLNKAWTGADAPEGVYTYLVSYKSSTGEYIQLTGYVTLIR